MSLAFDMASRAKWGGRAQAYAETFAGQCAHAISPMLDALDLQPGERLLDVGTGAGAVAVAALVRGVRVTAADPDADMLALAAVAAPDAVLRQGALPDLDLGHGDFDAITANFVLNHVGDPGASARRLGELLRPGGRRGVSIWPAERGPLFRIWDEVVAEAGVSDLSKATLPAHLEFPRTPDGLNGLLSAAGLSVREAWLHDFEHVADPDLWWSAAERGVASIGQVYLARPADGQAAMREAWRRVSTHYLDADGRLRLHGTALIAAAARSE